MLLFFLVVTSFSTLFLCPHCHLFVSAPCLLAHVLPVLTHPPICAFQFVSPPCLLHVLTYPPICAIQFVSPPCSLHILTYPLICAIQFVSPPHLLTHSAPCPDLPTHLCLPVCESPSLTHSLPVLTCPPICDFQFMRPPHLLCILTYPPICAIQFVSPPHLLTCSTPCPDFIRKTSFEFSHLFTP